MSVTAEEMSGLSAEEQAALEDAGRDEADEQEALEALAEDEGAEDAPADEVESKPQDDSAPQTDSEPQAEPQAPPQPEPFAPKYTVEPVDEAQLAALDEQITALQDRYDDGDLTAEEYRNQQRALENQRRELERQQMKAELAKEFTAQTEQQREAYKQQLWQENWNYEASQFLSRPENAMYKEGTGYAVLQATLTQLAQEAPDKPQRWYLEEADRRVRAFRGEAPTAKASNASPPSREIPPNLGDMPNADIPETGGDEFAHLDKLTGLELEMALKKLSPADADRYLYGQ